MTAAFTFEQLTALVEALPAGIAVHEGENLVLVNQAMCKLTGYSWQQLLTMKFWDIFEPGIRDTLKQRGQARISGVAVPSRYEVIVRVKKIVADLKDFSRIDIKNEWEWADLRTGLDSTLNVVSNEIKFRADVVKDYGDLPRVRCLPSQLNQVFMNLLLNAAQSTSENRRGAITICCGAETDGVWVEVSDTGTGIPAENLKRIFGPSIPPSQWARAPGWVCRLPMASCKNTAAESGSGPKSGLAPPSAFHCRLNHRRPPHR